MKVTRLSDLRCAQAAFSPQEIQPVAEVTPIFTNVCGSCGSFSDLQVLRWNF